MVQTSPASVGDLVVKGTGYRFPGKVVSVYAKGNGIVMADVESLFHPGMIHIFPVNKLIRWTAGLEALLGEHIKYVGRYHSSNLESDKRERDGKAL